VQRIDFDTPAALQHELLGWADPEEPEEPHATPSGIRGFSQCRNPIAPTTTPTPNGCSVAVGPKGLTPVDVGWVSAAELMVRIDRVCDQQLTITFRAPARVGLRFNGNVVLSCGDPQWGSASAIVRVPSGDVRSGLNILRFSDEQGDPKPGEVAKLAEIQSMVIEPMCDAAP
jgi:hypothetical protein